MSRGGTKADAEIKEKERENNETEVKWKTTVVTNTFMYFYNTFCNTARQLIHFVKKMERFSLFRATMALNFFFFQIEEGQRFFKVIHSFNVLLAENQEDVYLCSHQRNSFLFQKISFQISPNGS